MLLVRCNRKIADIGEERLTNLRALKESGIKRRDLIVIMPSNKRSAAQGIAVNWTCKQGSWLVLRVLIE